MSAWIPQPRTRLPRFAETAVERARLTVVPRGRTRAPRLPFMFLVSLVLLAGVIGLLLFNTSMQQRSFVATALEAEAGRLHAEQQSLQMELDELRDPQRVAARAQRLGMVPLANPAFLRLRDDTVVGNAVPAAGTDAQRIEPMPSRKPPMLVRERVVVVAEGTPDAPADGAPSEDGPLGGGTTGIAGRR